ncbi:hypothetical protein SAMN02910456_02685 [Ruminococcaceae bacterium YRB3002]|nr:hypothetical protein SAMN02910456_02685 [Ruminococcaceae bacterium YRB3002]
MVSTVNAGACGAQNLKKLVIVPAYNEAGTVVELCREVKNTAPDYDIIVINDCSTDATLAKCREAGIHVLDLPVNLGIGGAMQSGYRYAAAHGYDIAVQVDGDGQHDPAYLGAMLTKLLDDGADMVVGSRFIEGEGYQSTALRRGGSRYFAGLIKAVTGSRVTDPTSGFRMAGKGTIGLLAQEYPQDYPEPESIVRLLRTGRRVVEIPVKMRERGGGTSSIGARNSVYYMIKVTIAILLERIRPCSTSV